MRATAACTRPVPARPAVDHRVATHKGERRRVEAMGNTIAPIDFSGSGAGASVARGGD